MIKNKKCPKCGVIKPLTAEFWHKNKSSKNGFTGYCKPCINILKKAYRAKHKERINAARRKKNKTYSYRTRRYQKLYGITCYSINKMWEEQDKKCAICKEPVQRFDIDHNHKNGQVRGLLCRPCNVGLGQFKDNINNLKEAIRYLNGQKQTS